MSVEFDRGSPGKFDSRTLSRETLSRWTGCIEMCATPRVCCKSAATHLNMLFCCTVIFHPKICQTKNL